MVALNLEVIFIHAPAGTAMILELGQNLLTLCGRTAKAGDDRHDLATLSFFHTDVESLTGGLDFRFLNFDRWTEARFHVCVAT